MRRPMATVQDLIEEAKVRALWWAICIFGICYFLSHTSKSMWTNAPMSIIIFVAICYLSKAVELRWKVQPVQRETYMSYMNKTQIPVNGPSLSAPLPKSRWKRKINSPPIEAAVHDFIDKVLQDFMMDLWYSTITPDKEAPELIKALILDAIGEISGRIREINLVELLTRDVVELVSNHLNLYRRNQSIIGVEIMGTLSLEERDDRLKHHLMISKELHPALVSPECEYKVLQRLFGGILSIVLKPREAQCPLVHCFARELLTCLVMQPVMNLASPGYINELIEYLATNAYIESSTQATSSTISHDHSDPQKNVQKHEIGATLSTFSGRPGEMVLPVKNRQLPSGVHQSIPIEDYGNTACPKPADWARVLEAATERRTQVLAPENLENMWTKGRNYKKKTAKLAIAVASAGTVKMSSEVVDNYVQSGTGMELATNSHQCTDSKEDKYLGTSNNGSISNTHLSTNAITVNPSTGSRPLIGGGHPTDDGKYCSNEPSNRFHIKRSSSTSDIKYQGNVDAASTSEAGVTANYKELYDCNINNDMEEHKARESPGHVSLSQGSLYLPKLRCRVVGAYFEKIGSNSFAVYSIAVSDTENKTWFVKRRYRNFERLHRQLKEIPNYTLHLPPKRFLSSSIDDRFVHQRCILLDKYLQDILSIANIAEQHEVWDFLSASSNNYSFGKSTSVMKTLAVNVDDAMDDIFRQFKGVSDGLRRKVACSSSLPNETSALKTENTMFVTWNEEYSNKHIVCYDNLGTSHSLSDDEPHDEGEPVASSSGWHSDNELNSKDFPPRVFKQRSESGTLVGRRSEPSNKLDNDDFNTTATSSSLATAKFPEDLNEIPPEWTPPKVSIPLLNLVDNIFQLKQRGWLRRQVFWISKQILQLMMEDAIDDWLFSQIHLLRRDDVIAYGIRWVQDVLWPNGTFFTKLSVDSEKVNSNKNIMDLAPNISWAASDKVSGPSSFEVQLEAARRASNVKKILLDGAPTTLVSLIGNKQYKKCAKDIYYFLESSVCVKQLAYGLLELLLLSLFPELHDLIVDVHQNTPSI